jgi:hypothetical protein
MYQYVIYHSAGAQRCICHDVLGSKRFLGVSDCLCTLPDSRRQTIEDDLLEAISRCSSGSLKCIVSMRLFVNCHAPVKPDKTPKPMLLHNRLTVSQLDDTPKIGPRIRLASCRSFGTAHEEKQHRSGRLTLAMMTTVSVTCRLDCLVCTHVN